MGWGLPPALFMYGKHIRTDELEAIFDRIEKTFEPCRVAMRGAGFHGPKLATLLKRVHDKVDNITWRRCWRPVMQRTFPSYYDIRP